MTDKQYIVKKRELIEVEINKLDFPNKGISSYYNEKVIIKNVLPGQKWQGQVIKIKNGIHLKPIKLLKESRFQVYPKCKEFGICGGCNYQNIDYKNEILLKESMVLDLFEENNIDDFEYLGIVKAPNDKYYRNKMEYSFGDEEIGGPLTIGMRKRNSYYEVADASNCLIADEDFGQIVQQTTKFFSETKETFYHKRKHEGSLRHIVIRKGFFTGEILVNLITTSEFKANINDYANYIFSLNLHGNIKGILHTINDSVADAIKIDDIKVIFGENHYIDKLFEFEFKISPFSFFQTNSEGAKLLYSTVIQFAGDVSEKIIFDLYCGTGTIAQIVSTKSKKVIGIDIVEEAVESAKENAKLNNINNCDFIYGDVLKVIDLLEENPDLIILDPPREGINPKAINKIIGFNSDQIIYVSCNPLTLVKDLIVFINAGYKIIRVKLHDMFPRTAHVESIVLMTRKDG